MAKINDKEYFNMFALMDKASKHPEDLTPTERKRLKELGLEVE